MKLKLLLFTLLTCFIITGCKESHHHKRTKETEKVYYVDNKYCYHDNNWIWYWLILNNGQPTYQYYSTPTYSPINLSQIQGATFVRGAAPAEKTVDEIASEESNPALAVGKAEIPEENVEVTQAETTEAFSDIPDNNSLDSMEGVPDNTASGSTTPSDSTSEGTSGSSDGGGSSGGGDGGGSSD